MESVKIAEDGRLKFETPDGEKTVNADAVILALGGGSWARLGSDGAWVNWLSQAGVKVEALKPSNCGFDVAWSPHFREQFNGHPIKSVVLSFESFRQQGEFIVTKEGVEGSLIYAASALMRDEIEANGKAVMMLDMAPDRSHEWLVEKLSKPRGSRSMSSHLEKTVGLKGVKVGLLHELCQKKILRMLKSLASFIKQLPIPLIAPRPLDEAISSAGGVTFESLDENLMIRELPGIFCAGEMLDWEAPTGGYLLTACFASGRVAADGVMKWIKEKEENTKICNISIVIKCSKSDLSVFWLSDTKRWHGKIKNTKILDNRHCICTYCFGDFVFSTNEYFRGISYTHNNTYGYSNNLHLFSWAGPRLSGKAQLGT